MQTPPQPHALCVQKHVSPAYQGQQAGAMLARPMHCFQQLRLLLAYVRSRFSDPLMLGTANFVTPLVLLAKHLAVLDVFLAIPMLIWLPAVLHLASATLSTFPTLQLKPVLYVIQLVYLVQEA
jgi:hypothetical protein